MIGELSAIEHLVTYKFESIYLIVALMFNGASALSQQTSRRCECRSAVHPVRLHRAFSLHLLDCNSAAKICEILISKLRWIGRLPTPGRLYFVEFRDERWQCGDCVGDANCTTESNGSDCDSFLEAALLSPRNEPISSFQTRDHGAQNSNTISSPEDGTEEISDEERCFHPRSQCLRGRCLTVGSHSRSNSTDSISSGFSSISGGDSKGCKRQELKYDSTMSVANSEYSSADTERRLRALEMKVDKLVAYVAQLCSKQ